MRDWVDYPSWGDPAGRQLLASLRTINHHPAIQEIWTDIRQPVDDVFWQVPTRDLWNNLTQDAEKEGKLRELILAAKRRNPALAVGLQQVLDAKVAGPPWYHSENRYGARLVGPGGRHAILDRENLRSGLSRVVDDEYPLLAITGVTGKSYSGLLLQHVVDPAVGLIRILDAGEEWGDAGVAPSVTAQEYMKVLCTRIGVSPIAVDPNTEPTYIAKTLVHELVGRSGSIDPRVRWLFLDGLDKMPTDVQALVGFLAHEVVRGQLAELRLIITGHPGSFSGRVLDVILQEEVAPVTEQHIVDFFAEIARGAGQDRTSEAIRALVDEALATAALPNLRSLSRVVRDIAHREFGP